MVLFFANTYNKTSLPGYQVSRQATAIIWPWRKSILDWVEAAISASGRVFSFKDWMMAVLSLSWCFALISRLSSIVGFAQLQSSYGTTLSISVLSVLAELLMSDDAVKNEVSSSGWHQDDQNAFQRLNL